MHFEVPKDIQVTQCPQNLPPVFNREKFVMYALLKPRKSLKKAIACTASLKGNLLGAKVDHKIPFTLENATPAPSLPVIHHLAAKALITDWETAQKEKKSIVDLSIESSVISSHTAFISIDEESSEPVSGTMKVYDIQPSIFDTLTMGGFGGMSFFNGAPAPPPPTGMFGSAAPASLSSFSFGGAAPPPPPTGSFGSAAPASLFSPPLMGGAPPPPTGSFQTVPASFSSSPFGGAPPPPPPTGLFGGRAPVPAGSFSRAPSATFGAAPTPQSSQLCGRSVFLGGKPAPPPSSQAFGSLGSLRQPPTKPTDTLSDLISAQKLNGSWELTSSFAQLIGKPLAHLEAACPIGREGVGSTVWATVLAVSLLRSRYSSQQDEWELIAMKAESWLKKQSLPPGTTLEKMFQDAHETQWH